MKTATLIIRLIIIFLISSQINLCPMTPKQKWIVGSVGVGSALLLNFLTYKVGAHGVKNQIDACNTSIKQKKTMLKDLKKINRYVDYDNSDSKKEFIEYMNTFRMNHKENLKKGNIEIYWEFAIHMADDKHLFYAYDVENDEHYTY